MVEFMQASEYLEGNLTSLYSKWVKCSFSFGLQAKEDQMMYQILPSQVYRTAVWLRAEFDWNKRSELAISIPAVSIPD